MIRVISACVTLVLCVGPASAQSVDDPTAAREHYDKGSRLYALGRFDEAVHEYELAYQAKDFPAFLFNIAQCYRLAGNAPRAVFFYKSYLSHMPDATNRAEVEARITDLEKGAPAQPAPAPIDTSRPRTLKMAGIAVGVVGVAMVIVGATLGGLAAKATNDLHNESTSGSAFDPSVESRGRAYNVAGPVLDAVGGAAVVTGIVLFAVGHKEEHRLLNAWLEHPGTVTF